MTVSVEQTEPPFPPGFTVMHYTTGRGKQKAWETVLRWCGLYLDSVKGPDRFMNVLRIRDRLRSRDN